MTSVIREKTEKIFLGLTEQHGVNGALQ